MGTVRIASAQTIEVREDVSTALTYMADVSARAEARGASLLIFPEGYLQGYLIEESSARRLALNLSSPEFEAILDKFPKTGPVVVVGVIEVDNGKLFNTAVVVKHGVLIGHYRKTHLLKAERAFEAGNESPVFEVDGLRFGINICYDTNFPEAARKVAEAGASLIVCCANNMMRRDKAEAFKDIHNGARGERCRETGLWLVSSDITGERDGKVSWGPTAILTPAGEVAAQLPLGERGLLLFDIPRS